MDIQISPIPFLFDNYAWSLHDGKNALIVDPGEAPPIKNFLKNENLSLSHILITHHHVDHCGGAEALKKEFQECTIIGPDDSRLKVCDDPVQGGEERTIIGQSMKVIHAPGHTKNHVLFYFPAVRALFTGDTLFSSGCGRLFEGSAEDLHRSLTNCAALEDDTNIFPGHEYTEENLRFALTVDPANPAIARRLAEVKRLRSQGLASVPTTIAMEKAYNPFLRVKELALRKKLGMEHSSDIEVFARLREMKDLF